MSGQKGIPLLKDEVAKLIDLVSEHPVLLNKSTNASNNYLKDKAWSNITDNFNATISSCPRKPEQLRLKWENLKKAARKRNTKVKLNYLKTEGGKPVIIPHDEILDHVARILGSTYYGYSVSFGDDAERDVSEIVEFEVGEVPEAKPEVEVVDLDPLQESPTSHLATPHKKMFFRSGKSKGNLKRQAIVDEVKKSVIEKNRAIAQFYDSKRKINEKTFALIQRKMELEIIEKENSCVV